MQSCHYWLHLIPTTLFPDRRKIFRCCGNRTRVSEHHQPTSTSATSEAGTHQGVELDDSLLLDLPLYRAWPLPPHDPDGVPGRDVVVVDQVAGAHHACSTPALGAVDTDTLKIIKSIKFKVLTFNSLFLEKVLTSLAKCKPIIKAQSSPSPS